MIEAKNFFFNIFDLVNSSAENSSSSDEFDKKLNLLESLILERNYEDAVEGYLLMIEKNLNGIMELQKMNF